MDCIFFFVIFLNLIFTPFIRIKIKKIFTLKKIFKAALQFLDINLGNTRFQQIVMLSNIKAFHSFQYLFLQLIKKKRKIILGSRKVKKFGFR